MVNNKQAVDLVGKSYKALKSSGEAIIQIEIEAYPGDFNFVKTPPSFEVEIINTSSNQDKTQKKTILSKMPAQDRCFIISVESFFYSVKKYFSKKLKNKEIELKINVCPTKTWEDLYHGYSEKKEFTVGSKHIYVVALKPKQSFGIKQI